jgi:hypothetical protein
MITIDMIEEQETIQSQPKRNSNPEKGRLFVAHSVMSLLLRQLIKPHSVHPEPVKDEKLDQTLSMFGG